MMIMMVMMRGGGCFEPITEAVDYIIEDVDNYFEIKDEIKGHQADDDDEKRRMMMLMMTRRRRMF